ncbi:uncharacterized protein BJ171DRAFT_516841 [Polychytrium aggregatum]|uniref:uncharacterized protein n=1 Tax=Polychytrium aggregatum TaxID=110093 RepID=UPI0022FDFD33|nr:uncharacterized protein BJ171DRAFT_516841 [Polychytrium aggregatum]KAI9201893.1 hypothetical protein BJ171DRAFT_516841 [Polychytrium aggregatum]
MADIALILTSVIFALLVLVGAFYFLVYFQHPEDKWTAWFPKVVVILGISLSAYNLFLLPFDVGNQSGEFTTTGIPMGPIASGFYITSVAIVLVAVPFTVYFYEGVDDSDESDEKSSSNSQLGYALKWLLPTLIFIAAIIFVMYWFIPGIADVPAVRVTGTLTPFDTTGQIPGSVPDYMRNLCTATTCISQPGVYHAGISPFVYIVAVVSLVGWIIFSIFGGVGIVSFPFDLIMGWVYRPKHISATEYAERKKMIGEQSQILMEAGKTLQEELKEASRNGKSNRMMRRLRLKENEFRKDVLILEYHYRRLEDCYKRQGGNLLLQILKLVAGLISIVLSVVWIIQVSIYQLPKILGTLPISAFLNDFLENVSPIPFIGTSFYAVFAFYILVCVIKGVEKLGMRILIISIHPLRFGETMMNSLVFNTGIVLLCSLSVAQFCSQNFDKYGRYTTVSAVFGSQLAYFRGIHYGYDASPFILLGFVVLTFLYTLYRPYKKQRENVLDFKW